MALRFLTNTEQNNSYLFLENFSIFNINNPTNPLNVPGISSIMQELFIQSDYEAFIRGDKTHLGFSTQNFLFSDFRNNAPNIFNGDGFGPSINDFINLYTSLIPFSARTTPGSKLHSITLITDIPNFFIRGSGFSSGVKSETNGEIGSSTIGVPIA